MSIPAIVPDVETPVAAVTDVNDGNGATAIDSSQRWRAVEKLVSRASPFGAETGLLATGEFEPFENVSIYRIWKYSTAVMPWSKY